MERRATSARSQSQGGGEARPLVPPPPPSLMFTRCVTECLGLSGTMPGAITPAPFPAGKRVGKGGRSGLEGLLPPLPVSDAGTWAWRVRVLGPVDQGHSILVAQACWARVF